mmetsp:Transcript_6196/g.17787  ORF Transcript_6196/g.17787 Transcript_6196/m.17787 type:complete len:209 (-) Transcript_6196:335-961(-)
MGSTRAGAGELTPFTRLLSAGVIGVFGVSARWGGLLGGLLGGPWSRGLLLGGPECCPCSHHGLSPVGLFRNLSRLITGLSSMVASAASTYSWARLGLLPNAVIMFSLSTGVRHPMVAMGLLPMKMSCSSGKGTFLVAGFSHHTRRRKPRTLSFSHLMGLPSSARQSISRWSSLRSLNCTGCPWLSVGHLTPDGGERPRLAAVGGCLAP